MDNHFEKETVTHKGKATIAWGLSAAVLALGIVGLGWYVYPRLQQQSAAIAELRSAQSASDHARDRAVSATSNTSSRDSADQELRDQVTTLERRLTQRLERSMVARVASARKEANQASEDVFQRAQALVDMQIHAVETRLARLESSNANADSRVAELRNDIGQLRQQLARQESDLQSVRSRLNDNATAEHLQIADLKKSEERDHHDVDSVAASLATHHVDFEITKHHTSELAPGIYLHIDRADPAFRNVDGWMRVMPADHMFWLHRQNVQEPVLFYGANDNKQCELVLTAMRGNSIKGYLLMPDRQSSQIASAHPGL